MKPLKLIAPILLIAVLCAGCSKKPEHSEKELANMNRYGSFEGPIYEYKYDGADVVREYRDYGVVIREACAKRPTFVLGILATACDWHKQPITSR